MNIKDATTHVIVTGLVSVIVFALLSLGRIPEPIFLVIAFLFGGILRMIMLFITEWRRT